MPKSLYSFLLSLFLLAMALPASSTDYKITVNADDATSSDIDLIVSTMNTSAIDTVVSKSLRKVAMGAVGEVDLLVHQCIDESGNLNLDDGSVVPLLETDTVTAQFISKPGAVITWGECTLKANGKEKCRPIAITVQDQYGNVRRFMTVPPEKVLGKN